MFSRKSFVQTIFKVICSTRYLECVEFRAIQLWYSVIYETSKNEETARVSVGFVENQALKYFGNRSNHQCRSTLVNWKKKKNNNNRKRSIYPLIQQYVSNINIPFWHTQTFDTWNLNAKKGTAAILLIFWQNPVNVTLLLFKTLAAPNSITTVAFPNGFAISQVYIFHVSWPAFERSAETSAKKATSQRNNK